MRYLLIIVTALFTYSCMTEEPLTQSIEHINLYSIEHYEGDDPIKKRVYDLYKEYGVPIYFNDTIASWVDGVDYYGNEIVKYETLDLAWRFTSYSNSELFYKYLTDEALMTDALDYAEYYLKNHPRSMYPLSFFFVDEVREVTNDGVTTLAEADLSLFTRAIFGIPKWGDNQATIDWYHNNLIVDVIKSKINNYPNRISQFSDTTEPRFYNVLWEDLNPSYFTIIDDVIARNTSPAYVITRSTGMTPEVLAPFYFGGFTFLFAGFSEEYEIIKQVVAETYGAVGFVYYSPGNFTLAPRSASEDLTGYLTYMFGWGSAHFESVWGDYPIVMAKYEILKDIINNEFKYEF